MHPASILRAVIGLRFSSSMSSQASVSRLPHPVRELVVAASQGTEDFGKSEKDKAEVTEWISKVAEGTIAHPSTAKVRYMRYYSPLQTLMMTVRNWMHN